MLQHNPFLHLVQKETTVHWFSIATLAPTDHFVRKLVMIYEHRMDRLTVTADI